MLNFKKEKVNIDDKLKQRIDFICKFCGFKPTFESGNIISLEKTNLYYIEPNKAIINDILILFFNYSNEVYINNLNNKVLLKDLEDYLNSLRYPELYDGFIRSWKKLDRISRQNIIMHYINNIELEQHDKTIFVKNVNFRNTFLKDFNNLFSKGYLDWKIDNDLFETVRYSNYMDEEHIKNHLNKLRKYYDVSMNYGKFNQNTNILNFSFNPTHELIRIFPIENDFSKEEVNMGMLSIHEVKLYPHEKLEEEMYSEFMTEELLSNTPGATLDDVVEITEDGAEYRYQ